LLAPLIWIQKQCQEQIQPQS